MCLGFSLILLVILRVGWGDWTHYSKSEWVISSECVTANIENWDYLNETGANGVFHCLQLQFRYGTEIHIFFKFLERYLPKWWLSGRAGQFAYSEQEPLTVWHLAGVEQICVGNSVFQSVMVCCRVTLFQQLPPCWGWTDPRRQQTLRLRLSGGVNKECNDATSCKIMQVDLHDLFNSNRSSWSYVGPR